MLGDELLTSVENEQLSAKEEAMNDGRAIKKKEEKI